MDDIASGEPVGVGDASLTGRATAEGTTLLQQLRPGGAVDGTIDPAAAQQRLVGGIDNGIDL